MALAYLYYSHQEIRKVGRCWLGGDSAVEIDVIVGEHGSDDNGIRVF